jgi:HAE1 family hydrophobic/amphiphilic exporter-1
LRGVLTEKKQQRIFFWSMVVLFVLAFGLVFAGMIKTELFPQDDQSYVVVSIEKSEGSSLESTDLVVRQVEEILYEQKYVESFVTTVGASSALTDNSGGSGNSKFANITVILPDERELTSSEVVDLLRDDFKNIRDGIVKVGQANNGPPSGKPVAIKFLGDDLEQISAAADKAENILLSIEGTEGVETSLKDDSNQFELVVDKQKAAAAGLSPIQIASTLRTAVSGSIATTIKKQDDDIDILVRVDLNDKFINPEDANRANLDNLQNIEIMTPRGGVILGSILEAKLSSNKSVISHEDQKRVVTVSSDLKDGKTATEIVNEFQKREAELKMSPDVQIKYGGETEDVDNTFRDMLIALIAGMVLMLAILVLEFNSFRYSFYLLSAVPLSLIGVFFGLFVTGKALSFSAMLGIVALAGVVINHAIILLDSIIHRLDREIERVKNDDAQDQNILLNAIVDSSAIRLRPIVLTTLTTVVGMIPLANVSALWGPLAITIMFGLLFSMVLTLIFIPLRFYKKPGKRYSHLKVDAEIKKSWLAQIVASIRVLFGA